MPAQAVSVARPFMSAPELAAVGEVLATRAVLVLVTVMRSAEMPSVWAAIPRIFMLTPWPISTAPVETATLPSV